ncbi:MAG: hypothetical protein ACK56I_16205, partial [bacterium]
KDVLPPPVEPHPLRIACGPQQRGGRQNPVEHCEHPGRRGQRPPGPPAPANAPQVAAGQRQCGEQEEVRHEIVVIELHRLGRDQPQAEAGSIADHHRQLSPVGPPHSAHQAPHQRGQADQHRQRVADQQHPALRPVDHLVK